MSALAEPSTGTIGQPVCELPPNHAGMLVEGGRNPRDVI
jgi:hypothetical protein